MISPQTEIRQLQDQLHRERKLVQRIIDAAQDLKAVSGDPTPFLLQAARDLQKAINAYYQEVPCR